MSRTLATRGNTGKPARWQLLAAITALGAAVFAAMLTVPGPVAAAARLSEGDMRIYREAFRLADRDKWDDARRVARQADDKLPAKVLYWLDLARPNGTASFDEIVRFVRENPDWPNLSGLRRQAETIMPSDLPYPVVLDWFSSYTPLSTAGFFRYIDALMASNQDAKIAKLVRQRWIESGFGPQEEQDFRFRFGTFLRDEDHVARLDRLLWDGQETAARRMFPLVDEGDRALAEARMALANDAKGSEAMLARVPAELRDNPGLLYERLRWRRRNNQDEGALDILAKAPDDLVRPAVWWTERHIMARRALEANDHALAYKLARNHGQTDGMGLAQGEFLAGWLALRFLDKPKAAFDHFKTLYDKTSSPISRSRGAYWMARAAEAVGDKDGARHWYDSAADHGTTFYGQLAAARLGRIITIPGPDDPVVGKEAEALFNRREVVRVIRMLNQIDGRAGDRVSIFVRKLGNDARNAAEYALAARLAEEIGRPDLAVTVAKKAVQEDGIILLDGYPVAHVGDTASPERALVLSLIRQESTFNQHAVSAAGARGLMQLMPATARQVADKLGIKKHQHSKLTADPSYNVQLGSAYIAELLDRFNGSYVLAIASYNAGVGRVRGWLETMGDPRADGIDVVDWIEMIPIYETRNYVQRVMEGVMVYRARLNGGKVASSLEKDLKR